MRGTGADVPTGAEPERTSPVEGEAAPSAVAEDQVVSESGEAPEAAAGSSDAPGGDLDATAGMAAEVEVDVVFSEIAAVMSERDEYRDSLVRLQADFENYKKRVSKQTDDMRDRAAESLVEKLLPVLDTAELAIAHGGGEGVAQLSATLSGVLEREGLERIDKAGEPFDPNCHDAVAHEPGDGGQEVAEVMRSGYRWRGRVLRPAMVKVRG